MSSFEVSLTQGSNHSITHSASEAGLSLNIDILIPNSFSLISESRMVAMGVACPDLTETPTRNLQVKVDTVPNPPS